MAKNKKQIIKEKFRRSKRIRISAVVVLMAVLAICSAVFVGNELFHNSRYYLGAVQKQEQKYVEFLSEELDRLYQSGCRDKELCSFLEDHGSGSGNSFYYLVRNRQVIFSRDQQTTDSLGKYRDFDFFKSSYADEKVVWSNAFFGGGKYEVGSVYSQDYLLKQAKVSKHNVYIVLPMAICTVIYFILVVAFASFWTDSEHKNQELKDKIVEDSLKIENLLKDKELMEQRMQPAENERNRIYNRNVVLSLLRKSDDPELLPLSVMIVKVLNRSMFSYGEFYGLISVIRKHMNSVQMIAETGRDEITVLMYHTSRQEAALLNQKFIAEAGKTSTLQNMQVRTEIISTDDSDDQNMLKSYEETAKKMKQEGMILC